MMLVMSFVIIASCVLSVYVTNYVNFEEGTFGFIRNVMYRVLLVVVMLIIGGVAIWRLKNPVRSFRTTLLCCAAIVSVPVVVYYSFRNVVKDVPNLDNPTTVYLSWLSFDDDISGDGPSDYYVSGKGMDGEEHSFSISYQSYKKGHEMWLDQRPLFARVDYYPATEVVDNIEFMYEPDEGAMELYEPSETLSDNWDSYCFEVNGEVYHIATPVSSFLENGWTFENEGDGEKIIVANDEPNGDYGEFDTNLISQNGQTIKVTLYNPQTYDIPAAEAIVGSVYIIYGDFDFLGNEFRLPGGLMMYWSTKDDIISCYGEPDKEYTSMMRYEGRNGYDWETLWIDGEGRLDAVMIHNFPYFKRS